jgi:hypothetical protein
MKVDRVTRCLADWKPPAEFDDWEEYEAALDLLILELGQALAAAWTAAQFERALDGMRLEHGAGGAKGDGNETTQEPPVVASDDIMGQLLAQRGMVRRRSRHLRVCPAGQLVGSPPAVFAFHTRARNSFTL